MVTPSLHRPDQESTATETIATRSQPKRPRTKSHLRPKWVVSAIVLAVLVVLIVIPAGFVALAAVSRDVPRPGNINFDLTLENFLVLMQPEVGVAFLNTLVIALVSTLVALVIGGGLAFLAARTDIVAPRFVYMVGLMPMFLPSYVGALSWAMLGSPNAGLLNIALRDLGLEPFLNMYSLPGLILVFSMYYSPYAFLLIHSAMSLMNPDLEAAASVHGASTRRMLMKISLPLAVPAIIGSAMLMFVLIFENFPVAQVLGSPGRIDTLPTYIYRLLNTSPSRGNESAAIAVVLVLVVVLITWLQQRLLAKRSYTTVTGKGVKASRIRLGRARVPLFLLVLLFFFLSIILPILALLLTSARTSPYMSSFADLARPGALDFSEFFAAIATPSFMEVTYNSVVVAIAAAVLGTLLAFVASYIVYRTKFAGRRLIENVSMVPLAIPAVVLGMGLLWTWLIMPIPLYGTLAVMVIAFLAVQAPQGFRGISSSILATDRDLEDSAVMLGASRPRAIAKVTIPLMKVGILSTFTLLLMLSMRELTVPLFLYTHDTKILSIAIFDAFENGGALQTAASMSLVYTVLMFVLSYIPRVLLKNK